MTTLLIILLGTVLIRNSATLSGATARSSVGTLRQELRRAVQTSLTLTAAALLGFGAETALTPLGLQYLRTVVLVLLLAGVFAIMQRPWRPAAFNENFLGYFTEHCAVWGLALFSAWHLHSWSEALSHGIGAGVVLSFLDAAFRAHRERFATEAVPFVCRGIPLDLVTAGLMALALYGFVGF